MTVEGKMFGLTFHEQWYLVGQGEGWRAVAYRGDTQQVRGRLGCWTTEAGTWAWRRREGRRGGGLAESRKRGKAGGVAGPGAPF